MTRKIMLYTIVPMMARGKDGLYIHIDSLSAILVDLLNQSVTVDL